MKPTHSIIPVSLRMMQLMPRCSVTMAVAGAEEDGRATTPLFSDDRAEGKSEHGTELLAGNGDQASGQEGSDISDSLVHGKGLAVCRIECPSKFPSGVTP